MIASLSGHKVIVAALVSAKVDDPEVVLAEHAARIMSKGGIVVGQVLQRRGVSRADRPGGSRRMDRPMDPSTYLGKGKAQEIAELRRATGAELVVVCAKLSLSQLANLERIIGCPVLDATVLE
jgi:GTP-binding protein HflX